VKAVEGKNLEEARKALARAIPTIQKVASKKVIHKKTAARRISRLTKKVNALTPPA
jgi:small subunit ribosomal protein S20